MNIKAETFATLYKSYNLREIYMDSQPNDPNFRKFNILIFS